MGRALLTTVLLRSLWEHQKIRMGEGGQVDGLLGTLGTVPGLLLAILALAASGLGAQETTQQADSAVAVVELPADSLPSRPSPASAFLRGVIIPGWGHTTSGSLTRGAFYFGVESLAGWMFFKSARRLRAAEERLRILETRLTEELARQGITNLDEVDAALEEHEGLVQSRGLVEARKDQREDWIAPALFFLLVSGVDAFVSAHLQDFPQPLTVEGSPDGTMEISIRVPTR